MSALCGLQPAEGALKAHFPMEPENNRIKELISGNVFDVKGVFPAESVDGAKGKAMLFDGYSTMVDASVDIPASMALTFSLWAAVPCYPTIEIDRETSEKVAIASCFDAKEKKGFGIYLGKDGIYEFKLYSQGWELSVKSSTPLPVYEWNNITGVADFANRSLKLYCNGKETGSVNANGSLEAFKGIMRIGHGDTDRMQGRFNLMAFCGAVDDIRILDEAVSASEIASWQSENPADLTIPTSRFAGQNARPRFHGMPGANWTNESHGMTYSNGRWHVFFQKNANGPYMSRLHWGHISSSDLCNWREERIAFAPEASYDKKGCWSGAVFTDSEITDGKPAAIYTGVDYAKACIAMAKPTDDDLIGWQKISTPLIANRPAGLSDDFRDPYFFRNGDKAYIIVGSSKDGKGVTTLHRYDKSTRRWSNDGSIFFTAPNASVAGTFWEMPNVTDMGNGKWLFTATPLGAMNGVRTMYWTGSINADGTFAADAASAYPRQVELISKEGYGLLSPTIYQKDGKTIVLGIVPDKLPGADNYNLGWAHCYSLPREWSLDDQGNLRQQPYEGLKSMRGEGMSTGAFDLNGTRTLEKIDSRHAEARMEFTAGSTTSAGFRFFKGGGEGRVAIENGRTLTVDLTDLSRLINDGGAYNGIYTCALPSPMKDGEQAVLHVFFDGSVVDVFVNDRWATSLRVFPTASDISGLEAFSTGAVKVKSLEAWNLTAGGAGIGEITADNDPADNVVNVYTLDGMRLLQGVDSAEALDTLPAGAYIVGNRKVLKRN